LHTLVSQPLITSSPLFRDLDPQEFLTMAARFQTVSYPQSTRIIERGVWHGYLYIIASGSVNVLLQEGNNSSSPEIVLAHLQPGECFGEMSLITGELPGATIRAEQDTVLWSLSYLDFMALTATHPTLLRNMNQILSMRLAQTNQQVVSTRHTECVWLDLVHSAGADALMQRSLAFHIAHALAERSYKRVCLLEMCDREQAVVPRFATYPDQLRPDVLACTESHSLLQRHRAPTSSASGQHFPALAVLCDGQSYEQQEEFLLRQESLTGSITSTLRTLAVMYDYLLIVTTPATPPHLVQMTERVCQRSVMLISSSTESIRYGQNTLLGSRSQTPRSVFVAHIPEQPTLGTQDHYAAQLGLDGERPSSEGDRLVRLLPADTALLERSWRQRAALSRVMPAATLTKAVDFVARHLARQTVGIAFGGGSARGFAHLGVLKRLLERNIPLDYVSACSIGCIPASLHLLGKSLEEIEEIFLQIHQLLNHWNLPRTSLFSNKSLKRRFLELTQGQRFEDLSTPFAMVAVDLIGLNGVMLDHGPLWQAGLASVSLPGIFPPVMIGKHALVDAGLHDPVPVGVLRSMGADILIASDLSVKRLSTYENARSFEQDKESNAARQKIRTPHIVDVLLRSFDMTMATIGMHSLREADVAICPQVHSVSLHRFSEGHKFVTAGYDAACKALPALRERLPWLAQ